MLEQMDLTSAQRVRLECISEANSSAEIGIPVDKLIMRADAIEDYVRNGFRTSPVR